MRNLDILAAESGEHVRVLLCREEQSYVVSCQHFRMPYPVASDLLAELQPVPAETYSVFVLDEDITNRQREGRNRKLDLIAPLLEDGLWHYQYTQYATDLTPELENWLYRKTQGIPDILTKLLYNAQKQAILDGREKLDLEVFGSAFLRNLTGGRTYATKIETALLNLYGNYIPTADISAKQLHATLCSKSVAPRYVLQLAVLLGLSLHDLLHAPDAVPDYKAEMKAMYQSGASMYHIAQLYGTDAKTVARWVK